MQPAAPRLLLRICPLSATPAACSPCLNTARWVHATAKSSKGSDRGSKATRASISARRRRQREQSLKPKLSNRPSLGEHPDSSESPPIVFALDIEDGSWNEDKPESKNISRPLSWRKEPVTQKLTYRPTLEQDPELSEESSSVIVSDTENGFWGEDSSKPKTEIPQNKTYLIADYTPDAIKARKQGLRWPPPQPKPILPVKELTLEEKKAKWKKEDEEGMEWLKRTEKEQILGVVVRLRQKKTQVSVIRAFLKRLNQKLDMRNDRTGIHYTENVLSRLIQEDLNLEKYLQQMADLLGVPYHEIMQLTKDFDKPIT